MGLENQFNANASRDLNNFVDSVLPIVSEDGIDEDDFDNEEFDRNDVPDYGEEYVRILEATMTMHKSLELKLNKILAQNEIIMKQNEEILRIVEGLDVDDDELELSSNSS